ncbi:LIM domain-containing protein B-like [Schistocerca gregaria]|uniref:LIM domain-containing protein B-like n=1 Tax=Schistocerca gregaria TaxID=7010 RepID=UPI00211E4BC2|nr:LIM domain-containing protein B-like [Schistocerca gregaria]
MSEMDDKISSETLSKLRELEIDLKDIILDNDNDGEKCEVEHGSNGSFPLQDLGFLGPGPQIEPGPPAKQEDISVSNSQSSTKALDSVPSHNGTGSPAPVEAEPSFTFAVSSGPGKNWSRKSIASVPVSVSTPGTVVRGPSCANCGELIEGPFVTAVGKSYHPAHFVCVCCSQPFPGGKFLVRDDEPYCENDYYELFSERCRTCDQVIRGRYIQEGNFYYHTEHFLCSACGAKLAGAKYVAEDDDILCVSCNKKKKMMVQREICAKCSQPIIGSAKMVDGKYVHYDHFTCAECDMPLSENCFNECEDCYYCNEHYRELMKKLCYHCNRPIKGRIIHAIMHLWHPEHFCCTVCGDNLSSATFFEHEGKAYCKTHFLAISKYICEYCKVPVITQGVVFLDKHYHIEHFLCTSCSTPLNSKNLREWDSKPYCVKCYKKLPSELRKKYKKNKVTMNKIKKKNEMKAAKKEKEKQAQNLEN